MLIQPKLTNISSTKFDVESGQCANRDIFAEWIDLSIEATDGVREYGGDGFAATVCSLGWITRHVVDAGAYWGHSRLIVSRWDVAVIRKAVEDLCELSAARDWNEVVRAPRPLLDCRYDRLRSDVAT